jgi:hypothetical protein
MSLVKRLSIAALALTLVLAAFSPLLPANDVRHAFAQDDEISQALVQVVALSETFADWLPNYEGWYGNAWETEYPGVYYVEFYNGDGSEWLGYATINRATGEIYESFAPKPLSPDMYQHQLELIETLVLDDSEVAAVLGDARLWDRYTDYNRWEQVWEVRFYRGLDAILVRAALDENDFFWLDSIADENELTEDQAIQDARDRAVSLAYDADGVDRALTGYDNWTTIVQHIRGSQWSVSFVVPERELFYALVDLATARVVESRIGQ